MNNKDNRAGSNLEEINEKKVLNFGNLSGGQNDRSLARKGNGVSWDEAWIKCRRCSKRRKTKWESDIQAWNINNNAKGDNWKVYLFKSQVKKNDSGYQITGGIEFYCSECDWKHNYWESK